MPNISLKNINKVYPNGFQAVHDFNLEINNGELIVLVGPSGCGKSTTLRMIAGLEDITNGELLINGKVANALSSKQRGVAMVFQSYALYPHLSVYDNLGFSLTLQGLDEDVIDEKVHNVARLLGLEEYIYRKPRELSGGQRQRVAVGRAIIRKVDIFLMDEPLSNLDAKQRVTMRSEIIDLHRQIGSVTIYVTHDQTEAMTMADRIVVMKDGYIQQVGTPKELYYKPLNKFVAGFIGEPPMNFIDDDALNDEIVNDLNFFKNECKRFKKNDKVDKFSIGFRPESASLDDEDEHNSDFIYFNAKVELREMLGDSANLYVRLGNKVIILKIDSHEIIQNNKKIIFKVPKKSIYFFDENDEAMYI